ncbi:Glutathione S-transferase [Trichinella pseudospiralis]|uniref:Glutathione S-transferase n=1 Tax=Trichinella pseudospiralis TaxID=6337 RepID=A0A0V1ISS6_TRIPS|nr:Glutathione S-transferase [Trichinella pseudospiralis]KRZ25761.1 Glutathione S-transferase [Trichinella pseudospiralis]
MSSPSRYSVVYGASTCFIEQIHMLLRDQQVPYNTRIVNSRNSNGMYLSRVQYKYLPCIFIGTKTICQCGAIMRHLARQFDLYGTSEDMSYVDEERSRNFFLQNILPLELGTFEALLMGKSYFLNEKISFVDYTMFEMLRLLLALSQNYLRMYPALLNFYMNMWNRPNISPIL